LAYFWCGGWRRPPEDYRITTAGLGFDLMIFFFNEYLRKGVRASPKLFLSIFVTPETLLLLTFYYPRVSTYVRILPIHISYMFKKMKNSIPQ